MAGAAALPFLAIATGSVAQRDIDEEKWPALMGGDFATATSQLALERAPNGSVRAFAELEIAEQAAVATAFGAEPGEAGLGEEHQAMLAELEAAEGEAFDAQYVEGQIAGHEPLLEIHQGYASEGDDPVARCASIVGVTGIQTHLMLLRSLRDAVG